MFQQNSRETRGEIAKVCFSVIASEANQSMSPRKERMDCFVASAPRNDGLGTPAPSSVIARGVLGPET
jgi:hypothetical protein